MSATTSPPDGATTTIATADLHTVYEHNGIVVMTNTTGWVQFIVVWDTGTGKGKAILQSPPPG